MMAVTGSISLRRSLIAVGIVATAFLAVRWYQQDGVASGTTSSPAQPPADASRIARQATGVKIVLVGVDSADWQIIDPLIEAGRMPNLKRLREKGCWGRLRTVAPVLSPVLWTSIATGREPADHGILDFIAADAAGKTIPVTSNFRKTQAIWNMVTRSGAKVGVTGWWATWPAEVVDGYVVTDKLAYQLFGLGTTTDAALDKGMVFPERLGDHIRPLVRHKKDVSIDTVRRYLDLPSDWDTNPDVTADDRERVDLFTGYVAQAESYRRIALDLSKREKPLLDMVYFEAPDEVSHMFMCFRPPAMSSVDTKRVEWFGQAVDRYYEETDRIIGDFANMAESEGAAIVICSDHGFKSGPDRPNTDSRIGKGAAADWHRKYGIIVCAGRPFATGGKEIEEASVLDITPTILAALGMPTGQDMDGRVLEDAFDGQFFTQFPHRRIASYETDPSPRATADATPDSGVEQEQLDALAALGYIDGKTAVQTRSVAAGGESQSGPNYHNNKGTLLLQDGLYNEAIDEFRAALASNREFVGARINLGRAYRLKGDLRSSRDVLETLLRENGPDKSVYHELGRVAMDEKNFVQAEAWLRKAVDLDPNDVAGINSLAELMELTGRFEEAIATNRRCIEIDPDNEQGYNNIGNIYRRLGNPKEAEAWYRKAIKADSDFAGSYNNLGLVLQDQGRLDEAEEQFNTALEKYSAMGGRTHEYAVVVNSIGTLNYFRSQKDRSFLAKAKARFEEALRVDPKYPEAHNNLGAVLGIEGKPQEELREYETAVKLEPRYIDGLFNLGKTYFRMGQGEKALGYLTRAIEVSPRHMMARVLIATIQWQRGEGGAALETLDESLRIKPDFLPAVLTKSGILTKQGRLEEAAIVIEGALSSHPADPSLLTNLHVLYTTMGRPQDAARIKAQLDSLGSPPAGPPTQQ